MITKLFFLPFLLLRIVAYPFGHRWHKAKLRDTWSGDGDSFWIVTTKGEVFQVRLLGIDCPEHSQPFGAEAGDRRKLLCGDQTFKVRCRGRDVYGRWLSSVTLPKGGNLAICLLNEGMAHDTGLSGWAEFKAKFRKRGIWSIKRSERVAPWKYRKHA